MATEVVLVARGVAVAFPSAQETGPSPAMKQGRSPTALSPLLWRCMHQGRVPRQLQSWTHGSACQSQLYCTNKLRVRAVCSLVQVLERYKGQDEELKRIATNAQVGYGARAVRSTNQVAAAEGYTMVRPWGRGLCMFKGRLSTASPTLPQRFWLADCRVPRRSPYSLPVTGAWGPFA